MTQVSDKILVFLHDRASRKLMPHFAVRITDITQAMEINSRWNELFRIDGGWESIFVSWCF